MKKGLLAAFLYLFFAAAMVSDGLFTDKVGINLDCLYTLKPWDALENKPPIARNPALDYQASFVYPWLNFSLEHLREGKIPLWSHLAGGGTPFLGNLSCAAFFPLTWLALAVPMKIYFSLAGMIKLWLAAFLTYSLLRLYGLRFLSAFLGGLAFGFSGFMTCWLNHPHSSVALFLPALILAVEYFIRHKTGFAVVLNALLLGLQILGGSPETSFLLYVSWGLYLVYRIRQEAGLFNQEGIRLLFFGGGAGLLGAALAAFQLWPFFEYLAHSYGLEVRIEEWDAFLNGGPGRMLTLFGILLGLFFPLLLGASIALLQRKNTLFIGFWSGILGGLCLIVALRIGFWLGTKPHILMQVLPDLYGVAEGGCPTAGDISYSALNGGYAGVIPAFLALYALVAPCKRRPLPFFVFLFILSFGAAHSLPWLTHLVKTVPYLGWVKNSSLLCLTAFSVAVIAPFGLEDLMFRAANLQGRTAAIGGAMGAFIVVGLAVLASGWTFFETGLNQLEAERDPLPKAKIISPVDGSILSGVEPLVLHGRAGEEVSNVRAVMDGILIGKKRTEAASQEPRPVGGTAGPPLRYPRVFSFSYTLDTVDEGTYKIKVSPAQPGDDPAESPGGDWTNIRLVRDKSVTGKDLLILCLSCGCFLLLLSRAIPVALRASLAILILLLDLGAFGLGYNGTTSAEYIYPPTEVTDFLVEQEKPFRIFAEGGILPPNSNFPYGIEHMEWDDRLGIAGYWKVCNQIKYDHLAKPRQLNVWNFNLRHPLFDFMGVKYILVRDDIDLGRWPEFRKFKLVLDGPVRIYENTNARERAFIVGDWINLEDNPIAEVVRSDLRNQPVLRKEPPLERGGTGSVDIVTYDENHLVLSAETRGQALLILTDNYFPGWKAFVDGKETPILETTGSFRAVPLLEEGRHRIEFRYRPLSFFGGLYIAAAALVLCILIQVWPGFTAAMRKKFSEDISEAWYK